MGKGTIILLNGTSSAGKTSIVKALQQQLDVPFLDAGIDRFLWMLPGRHLDQPLWDHVFHYSWSTTDAGDELVITPGPLGHRLISGMHQAIVALAEAGNNVVADHVLLDPAWLRECATLFGNLRALFVGVRCPLEVVEQREKERGDRTLGQARAQYNMVHAHGLYDVEVDTSLSSPTECAQQIKQHLQARLPARAFKLHQQRAGGSGGR